MCTCWFFGFLVSERGVVCAVGVGWGRFVSRVGRNYEFFKFSAFPQGIIGVFLICLV
jgi:hypothetical protein